MSAMLRQLRVLAVICLSALTLAGQSLAVNPTTLTFSASQGGRNPVAQPATLTVAAGTSWSVTISNVAGPGNWLTITPTSGTGPARLSFSATVTDLGVGQVQQVATFTSSQGNAQVQVFFDVLASNPVLSVGSRGMLFTAQSGGGNPEPQTTTIVNDGTGALNWTASATGGSWLSIRPAAGTAPSTLGVTINISGLAPGQYEGRVTVTAANASGSPASFPVTLQVSAVRPSIVLSSTTLSFSARQGCPSPDAHAVGVTNPGGALSWTATTSTTTGGPWLGALPASATGEAVLVVRANTVGLSAGAYSGKVEVAAGGASNSPQNIAVQLQVGPAPTFLPGPATLNFTTQPGVDPLAQRFSIDGLNECGVSWTATITEITGGNWLVLSPASGNGSASISAIVNTTGLAPGAYSAVVVIVAPGAANSPQTVRVRLILAPAGAALIAPDPPALSFAANAGSSPAAQAFVIANAGGGTVAWTAEAKTQSGGSWLSINSLTGQAPSSLMASVNSATLAAGAYSGSITLTAAGAANSPLVIPVTLAVGAPVVGQNGVVNGASFSADAVVSPGSIASLFGTRLASGTAAATTKPLPLTLSGTQVLVNDAAAPLFFVSPGQINFQMPIEVTGNSASVAVVSGGVRGPTLQIKTASETPGIFSSQPGTLGQGAVLNQDFSANSIDNPAAPGSVIQIFATGLGATNPALPTGRPGATAPPFNTTVATPTALVNGAAAPVHFSAVAPGFIGLYQVNVQVPASTPTGGATLQVQIGGRSSNIVTFAVR